MSIAPNLGKSLREALPGLLPALRAYARALSRDSHHADDLVQEAILKALAAEAQWQEGTDARAWIFTILRRCWLTGLRRARWEAPLDEAAEARTPEPGETSLSELARAMDALPAVQREALMLVAAQGLSIAQAAIICEVAPGTIKARISRGRMALRARLREIPDLAGG